MSAEPHSRRILVWDVPHAIERGAKFRIKIGLKCTSGCRPAGWLLAVRDHDGNELAETMLGDESWPGTAALFFADVELRAPSVEGRHVWSVHAPAGPGETPHLEADAHFTVAAVPVPECLLKVIAIDRASQAPVKGARVVAHPYRALTDEQGVAEVRVPKGAYRLFVSGGNYVPFRGDGEVMGDVTITAELDPDLGPSDAELWS